MTKIVQQELPGTYRAGWNSVTVAVPHLPVGLYYGLVYGKSGGNKALRGPIAKVHYIY